MAWKIAGNTVISTCGKTLDQLHNEVNANTSAITDLEKDISDNTTDIETNATNISKLPQEIIDLIYPVGSTYIMPTNTTPASILGGTWELIDKEFTPGTGNGTVTQTNITSASLQYSRAGHSVYLTMSFKNNATLAETNVTLGTISASSVGLNNLVGNSRIVAWTDDGGGFIGVNIASGGGITHFDTIDKGGTNSMSAGKTFYMTWVVTSSYTNMLDSACNKFYWKRTA